MGHGDQLMATGMAKGWKARGKRIAFGDGRRIIWDQHSGEIFRGNPNIAPPGHERQPDIKWIAYHKGHRVYNTHDPKHDRWIWNYDFRPIPGEVFFDARERQLGAWHGSGFILVEPDVVGWKSSSANKDWGRAKYQSLVDKLRSEGHRVVQFGHEKAGAGLAGVVRVKTASFREALAVLSHAALYIGPEGGLHHGAAAVGIPAVVLFGGFIPPSVTGYDGHRNLTGGAEACGSLKPCEHCRKAMAAISVEEAFQAVQDVAEWT